MTEKTPDLGKASNNIKVIGGVSFAQTDKRVKLYRSEWERRPREHCPGKFPLHLDLESTSCCNLRCRFCATVSSSFSKGNMSKETVSQILEHANGEELYAIKFNWRGEPLLNEYLVVFINMVKKAGVLDVFFNTNATLLDAEKSQELISSNLDRIIISFDSIDKDIYERNRVNAKFDQTVANIKRFSKIRDKCLEKRPKIRLQTVMLPEAANQLESYRLFWESYADEITYIDLRDEEQDYSFLQSEWFCPYLFLRLTISWDGRVFSCPFVNHSTEDYPGQILGEVATDSLKDIWNGDRLKEMRQMHIEGKAHKLKQCANCSYRGTEILKLQKQAGVTE